MWSHLSEVRFHLQKMFLRGGSHWGRFPGITASLEMRGAAISRGVSSSPFAGNIPRSRCRSLNCEPPAERQIASSSSSRSSSDDEGSEGLGWSWISVDEANPEPSRYQDERLSVPRGEVSTKDTSEIITDVEATSVAPIVDLAFGSAQTDLVTLSYAVLIGGAEMRACMHETLPHA